MGEEKGYSRSWGLKNAKTRVEHAQAPRLGLALMVGPHAETEIDIF